MRRLFAAARDLTGNLAPLPDVSPDQLAPIVRICDGERQLEMMRWGCRVRPSSAELRLPTFATRKVRTGAAGSARRAAAWCR